MVSKIKENLDIGDEAKVGCEDSGRIKLCWVQKKDMEGNISPAAVISAFKKFPESIDFLIKIKCQQLVRDNENPKFKTIVERLIRQGFIDEIQVDIINKRHYFYVLSDKGNLTGMESTKIKKSLKAFVFKDFSFFAKPSEKKKTYIIFSKFRL